MVKKQEEPDLKNKEAYSKLLINAFNEASKITFSLVFFPIIILLSGVWLDKRFETKPLFILVGMVLGIIIGLFQASQIRKKYKVKK